MKKYRFIDSLKEKMTLVVSLTENNLQWAKSIESAGAHSVKVHINVLSHRASKTHFKSWEEEKENIKEIPNELSIPVGIVPGAEVTASLEEMEEIKKCGFDYLDINGMSKSVALDNHYPLDYAPIIEKLGADMIEASIIPPEEYGQPLTVKDISFYQKLISSVSIPVFIPTQRKIQPNQVKYLRRIGASGIAIGAVVTSKNIDTILRTTEEFRKEIDKLTE